MENWTGGEGGGEVTLGKKGKVQSRERERKATGQEGEGRKTQNYTLQGGKEKDTTQ